MSSNITSIIAYDNNQRSLKVQQCKNQKYIDEYNLHPKICLYCGAVIPYEKRHYSKFCNSSCAAKFNNKKRNENGWKPSDEQRKKTSNTLKQYYNVNKKIEYCKWCGAVKGQCKRPDICKHHQLFDTLVKYFGFDNTKIGTEGIYEEYEKCYNKLYDDYVICQLSIPDMVKKYNHYDIRNFSKILNCLNIPLRTKSESQKCNLLNGKRQNVIITHTKFVNGWHVDWQNNKWFYCSSYELDFMKKLDAMKTHYRVESLRLIYWDSQKQTQRIAIPDFYLPDTNEIYEIKGFQWWEEKIKQNMRDKFKAYKSFGYHPHLIYNGKEEFDF